MIVRWDNTLTCGHVALRFCAVQRDDKAENGLGVDMIMCTADASKNIGWFGASRSVMVGQMKDFHSLMWKGNKIREADTKELS